jgi:protoporphyrinogen oxidase
MGELTGILGAGISGLSLCANLTGAFECLEAAPRFGGLCASVIEDGFTFDAAGPHIMFSKNKDVLAYMVGMLGDNVHQRRRENKICYRGTYVKYPFENGLADLPKEEAFECVRDYIKNDFDGPVRTLADWAYSTFGKSISDKYLLPYNRKIWKTDPRETSLDWVARIPRPPMEDVLRSAIGIPTEGYTHQLFFYYPKHGGYEALAQAFAQRVSGRVRHGFPVQRVARDGDRWIVDGPGDTRVYDRLVSTIPIHELLRIWEGAPPEAKEHLSRLRYNSLINVLVGMRDHRGLPYTALYVPDDDVIFHRVSFPSAFSEHCTPEGSSSLMAEITSNRDGDGLWALDDEEIWRRTLAGLERLAIVDPERIVYRKIVRFLYGYPVSDLAYRAEVTRLREVVEAAGIHLLGRFAQFDYINSDVCVERALALAARLNGTAS